jgi:hypothetical protein
VIEPESRPLPATAVASEPYGGTRNDDKLATALFPVFVQRVALLCCGNCYLVVTKGTRRMFGVFQQAPHASCYSPSLGGCSSQLAQKQGTRYFRIDVLDSGHDGIAELSA